MSAFATYLNNLRKHAEDPREPAVIVGQVPPTEIEVRRVQAGSGRPFLLASYRGADLCEVSDSPDYAFPEFWIVRNDPEDGPGLCCYAFTTNDREEIAYCWMLSSPEAERLSTVESVCEARARTHRHL